MTTLRTAAQQALEALKFYKDCYGASPAEEATITALKEALVEDAMQKFTDVNQELQAALGCDHCNSPLYAAVKCRVCGRVTEPVQEPPEFPPHDDKVHAGAVYWYVGTDGKYYSSNEVKLFMETKNKSLHYEPPKWVLDNFDLIPLYTSPPQRKPEPNSDYERGFVDGMSEQARRSVDKAVNAMTNCKPLAEEEIARLVTNDMVKFARAIERAHGIDGAPEERHFCPRCGKRTNGIHTCTPPHEEYFCDTHCTWADHAPGCVRADPVQEPVAWRWGYRSVTTGEMDWRGYVDMAAHPNLRSPAITEPLYTSPPQRKPLTEKEIDSIWDSEKAFADIYAIVRAIERAHRIGVDK